MRWRNWRWKERTFTYPSITFARVENNGKNGFLRISSTEMGKRTCSFDPYQFDATILMAQVLYRDDHGRWAEEDYSGCDECGGYVWFFARYLCPVL